MARFPFRHIRKGMAWTFTHETRDPEEAKAKMKQIRETDMQALKLERDDGWIGVYRKKKRVTRRAQKMRKARKRKLQEEAQANPE